MDSEHFNPPYSEIDRGLSNSDHMHLVYQAHLGIITVTFGRVARKDKQIISSGLQGGRR